MIESRNNCKEDTKEVTVIVESYSTVTPETKVKSNDKNKNLNWLERRFNEIDKIFGGKV